MMPTGQIATASLAVVALVWAARPPTAHACSGPDQHAHAFLLKESEVVRPDVTLGVVVEGSDRPDMPVEFKLFREANDAHEPVPLHENRRIRMGQLFWIVLLDPKAPLEEGDYRLEVISSYAADPDRWLSQYGPMPPSTLHFEVQAGDLPPAPKPVVDPQWSRTSYASSIGLGCEPEGTQTHRFRFTIPGNEKTRMHWVELRPIAADPREATRAFVSPALNADFRRDPPEDLDARESYGLLSSQSDVYAYQLITHDLYGRTSRAVLVYPDECLSQGYDAGAGDRVEAGLDDLWHGAPACPGWRAPDAASSCSASPGGRTPAPFWALSWMALATTWLVRRRTGRRRQNEGGGPRTHGPPPSF